ncbi:helix-hairpin-helix domain-containing protein [Methanospirillum lacunae]|uniref:Protein kinase domain-containing protein n=1 Tax=Methanospirillum lacunae TaxID=668570 RepID=A0A2V2N830_9EURY|nr:hypothetical protein [Methanospirillum lacunae]PWR73856.1 hypothetical protein DK846_01420 [Methanospirillum lacunae]
MNSIYYNSKGNKVELGPEFGRGAEGGIFPIIGSPDLCAKIYTDKLQRNPERCRKLKYMVNNPPSNIFTAKGRVQIAWPNDILYYDNRGASFAGIIMPLIDVKSYKPAHYYYCPTDRDDNQVLVNWDHALVTSRNIATVLDSLHDKGYCVGDLQSNNILVNLRANVAYIDCDSFQVTDRVNNKIYYNTVGLPEYTPPELIGKDLKIGFDRKFSDLFALGTIIFQFLMQNALPYQAIGTAVNGASSPIEKIRLGLFPYGNINSSVRPPEDVPPWDILSPEIQELFIRCFVYGHKDEKRRPSAREWVTVIDKTRKRLKLCDRNTNHKYLNHLTHCPWCNINEDYYPQKKNQAQVNWQPSPPNINPIPVQTRNPQKQTTTVKKNPSPNNGFFYTRCSDTTYYTQLLSGSQILLTVTVYYAFFKSFNYIFAIIAILVSYYYLYYKDKKGIICWGLVCLSMFLSLLSNDYLLEYYTPEGFTYFSRLFLCFYMIWVILTLRVFSYEKMGWK